MKYTEFIEVQRSKSDVGGWGEERRAWNIRATFYAHVVTQRGREFVANERDTQQRRASFISWDRDDIGSGDRLIWQGDVYEVTSVVRRHRDNEIQIDAQFTEGLV